MKIDDVTVEDLIESAMKALTKKHLQIFIDEEGESQDIEIEMKIDFGYEISLRGDCMGEMVEDGDEVMFNTEVNINCIAFMYPDTEAFDVDAERLGEELVQKIIDNIELVN